MYSYGFGADIVFAYLKMDDNQLFLADYQIDCSYIRAFLKKKGINSMQLIQDKLSNIENFIDDLEPLGSDMIAFFVDYNNYYLVNILTYEIKMRIKDIKVIWFGEIVRDLQFELFSGTFADAFITYDEENNFYIMLELNFEKYQSSIDGIVLKDNLKNKYNGIKRNISRLKPLLDELPSPYINNFVPLEKLLSTGVCISRKYGGKIEDCINIAFHSVKRVLKDLDYIQSNAILNKNSEIQLYSFDLLAYPYYVELIEGIKERNYGFGLRGRASINTLDYNILDLFVKANFKHLEIVINSIVNYSQIENSLKYIADFLKSSQIMFSFIFLHNSRDRIVHKNVSKIIRFIVNTCKIQSEYIYFINEDSMSSNDISSRFLIPDLLVDDLMKNNDIDECLHKSEKKSSYSTDSFVNGFFSYFTGLYSNDNIIDSTKHVYISKEDIVSTRLEKLKKFTSLNSAIITDTILDKQEDNIGSFFNVGDGVVRKENIIFQRFINENRTGSCYPSHLYQIEKDGSNLKSKLLIDNIHKFNSISICDETINGDKLNNIKSTFKILEIKSQDDLDIFLNDIKHLMQTGKINGLYFYTMQIKDICRWGGSESCQLNKLPRFCLHDDQIFPCGGCSVSVGKLDDSYFDIVQNTYVITERERIKRKCLSCSIREKCSKCSLLPDFIDSKKYCETRIAYPFIKDYIDIMSTLGYLVNNTKVFKGADFNEIRIISRLTPCFYNDFSDIGEEKYFFDGINVYILKGIAYIFNPLNGKILKLNEELGCIVEVLIKGIQIDKIIELIQVKYSSDITLAKRALSQVFELLSSSGCIYKIISI